MDSLWSAAAQLPSFPPLDGDLETEVLIVGGGAAGLLCAWQLQQAGVDYALVEADRLCAGTTCRTTAKITAQHGLLYADLLRIFGERKARLYLRANLEALERWRGLCATLDCDFEPQDSFVYARADARRLEREVQALRTLGYPAERVDCPQLPFPTAGAVVFRNQAQFHPLKCFAALVPGLRLYEHTKVHRLLPGAAVTDHGTIRARKIILATHFPILNKHGAYFLKLYQSRSYVLALEGASPLSGMYLDEAEGGLSLRTWNGRLLLGGAGGRTGKPHDSWNTLTAAAHRYWPETKIVCRWAAQDCMPLDHVPYIGRYSPSAPGLYVATGFQKWGMTSSMVAAQLLCDLVQGRPNPFEELFSPSRSILHPQLAVNSWEAVRSLLTPTTPRCPHMGCALRWNPAEQSWDCSCHGSRFTREGQLLENPATDDLKRPPTGH